MSPFLYVYVYVRVRARECKIKNALRNEWYRYIKHVITTRISCYLISIRSKARIHENRLRHFFQWYVLNHSASSSKLFSYNRTASSIALTLFRFAVSIKHRQQFHPT